MSRTARLIGAIILPAVIAGLGLQSAGATPGATDPAIARTENGLVRGTVGDGFRTFVGVPFAAPPVGSLRWRPPSPAPSWQGVRDATRPGSPCPALPTLIAGDSSKGGSTNEDCLYLNVSTPNPVRHRLPVMVWIHGGGFVNGAGTDYDARVLTAKANAVVVTINYRLGPFGFLALPGLSAQARDHASGNFGLQDQQAALEWVRRNIAGFGGDPRNVTIFGESAGGLSVCAQLASPTASGLFQPAAPCIARPRTLSVAETAGATLAARLGCADAATQVACMRGKAVADILAAGGGSLGSFGPVVGGDLLPRQIPEAISSGRFNRVPVMEGTNHDEYRLFVAALFDLQSPVTPAQYQAVVARRFGANAPKVLAKYPLSDFASPSEALATVITDAVFACPARAADGLPGRARAHLRLRVRRSQRSGVPDHRPGDAAAGLPRGRDPLHLPAARRRDVLQRPAARPLGPDDPLLEPVRRHRQPQRGRARRAGRATPPAATGSSRWRRPPPGRSPASPPTTTAASGPRWRPDERRPGQASRSAERAAPASRAAVAGALPDADVGPQSGVHRLAERALQLGVGDHPLGHVAAGRRDAREPHGRYAAPRWSSSSRMNASARSMCGEWPQASRTSSR
jgi:para-nitrobenzyl esterase